MFAPRKVGCYADSKVFSAFYSLHGDTVYSEWRLGLQGKVCLTFSGEYLHVSALNCRKFCSVQDVRISMSNCNMARSSGVQIDLYIIMSSPKSVMLPSNRVG